MNLSRRDFLKYSAVSTALLSCPILVSDKAFEKTKKIVYSAKDVRIWWGDVEITDFAEDSLITITPTADGRSTL